MSKRKLNLYYGTVKAATGGRHFMAWANSREHALDLVEAALTVTGPVQGSVVGPVTSLPADVMQPGVFVEVTPALPGPGEDGHTRTGQANTWASYFPLKNPRGGG